MRIKTKSKSARQSLPSDRSTGDVCCSCMSVTRVVDAALSHSSQYSWVRIMPMYLCSVCIRIRPKISGCCHCCCCVDRYKLCFSSFIIVFSCARATIVAVLCIASVCLYAFFNFIFVSFVFFSCRLPFAVSPLMHPIHQYILHTPNRAVDYTQFFVSLRSDFDAIRVKRHCLVSGCTSQRINVHFVCLASMSLPFATVDT